MKNIGTAYLPPYGCENEPNVAETVKFGGSEKNTNWLEDLNYTMSDPCADQNDDNITYRTIEANRTVAIEFPAFNIDPNDANGLPLTPMLLEIMFKDTTDGTGFVVKSKIGYINPDPRYGITDPNNRDYDIAHLGDCNDGRWKYIQYAFQKSDFQLLRAINGKFTIKINSPSGIPIDYVTLRAITQADYEALTNRQRDTRGFYEIEMPVNNPSNSIYADPNLTVFVRDIMRPVYPNTKPDVNEPCSISTFSAWGEVEPACFSIYSENGINNLKISVSNLTNGSSTIVSSDIAAYQVICDEKRLACFGHSYALLPDSIVEFSNLSVEPNTSESIWLKIQIPKKNAGLTAGLYTGQVTIERSDGESNVYVPVEVNIYDITLDLPARTNPVWMDNYLSNDQDVVFEAAAEAGFDSFESVAMIDIGGDPCTKSVVFDANNFVNSIKDLKAEGFVKNTIFIYLWEWYFEEIYDIVMPSTYNENDPYLYADLNDPCFANALGALVEEYVKMGKANDINIVFFLIDEPGNDPGKRIIADRLANIIKDPCYVDPNILGFYYVPETSVTYYPVCDEECLPNTPDFNYIVPTSDGMIPSLTNLIDYKIWPIDYIDPGYAKHQDPNYHGHFGYYTTYYSQLRIPVYNRFLHGLFAFRTEAKTVMDYKMGIGINDPYNDFDGAAGDIGPFSYPDFVYTYTTWSGKLHSIIGGLEAIREGNKDARYIATLQKLIAENPNNAAAQAAQEYLDGLKGRVDPNYGQAYEDQSTELGHYQAILKEISLTGDPNDYEVFTEIRKEIAEHIKSLIVASHYPVPDNGEINVSINACLSWTSGTGATSHDVYFGTSYSDVNDATHDSDEYRGNQPSTTWDTSNFAPNGLEYLTTYYWRIDANNGNSTTRGGVWSFTTVPLPPSGATAPSPSSGATNVGITTDLSWTAGTGATSHDVYFGTVSPPPFAANRTSTTYSIGTMANCTTYYWRIDEKNAGGTTQGTVWHFTTAISPPNHHWALDETSGVTAYDSVDTNNGTFNGDDPCWMDGNGVDFNGVSDYFSVSDLNNVYTTNINFTVAGWFKTSKSTGIQTIIGNWSQWFQYNLSFSSGWQVLVENNKVKARFATNSPGTPSDITGATNVTDANWHHFALVYPKYGQSLNAVLYVDGNSEGTPGVKYFTLSNTKFRIGDGSYIVSGSPVTLKGGPFCGMIDDVMIFNRTLTADEVYQLYAVGR